MIDIDEYEIDDDVVWVWNESSDAYDDEKKEWVNGIEHANWQLWEYKECPPEKGGYPIYREGEDDGSTHVPNRQLIPDIPQIKWDKNMEAIMDVPFLIREIKRLRELLLPRIDEGYTTSYMDLRGIIENVHWELTGDDHESNEERIKHAIIALRDVIG